MKPLLRVLISTFLLLLLFIHQQKQFTLGQQLISFGQSIRYDPTSGPASYKLSLTGDRFVQFDINSASGLAFRFNIARLDQNPFNSSAPDNLNELGFFRFEIELNAPQFFEGAVAYRYEQAELMHNDTSVSTIVYVPSSRSWQVRGTTSHSTSNVASAAVSNQDFVSSSDIFFGFIENPSIDIQGGDSSNSKSVHDIRSGVSIQLSFMIMLGVLLAVFWGLTFQTSKEKPKTIDLLSIFQVWQLRTPHPTGH